MSRTTSSPALPALGSFGSALKYLRRRARLSQRELAIAVGYSESQISRFESHQRPPNLATLSALFVPALHLDEEPVLAARLLELAAAARGEPVVDNAPTRGQAGQQPGDVLQADQPPPCARSLPLPLTSFVGREREQAEVRSRLLDQHPTAPRLVTLTGTGGSGKTRLALQVTADLLGPWTGAAWLVELAPLSDPAYVPQAVATVLGVREAPGYALTEAVADYLRPQLAVLVLDNCEHVINACAALAEALLQACPRIKILATSREALGLLGEMAFTVQPLSLPAASAMPADLITLPSEAVQLFVERARAVQREFSLTSANIATVVHICQRLDGIPLAIELAVARIRALTLDQIAERLDDRFRLLAGGNRGALPRQQTLRATFDWSHDLLPEAERSLFRRLSVFQGGWTLEASEVVCADEALDGGRVLGLLMRLVDKSLVVVEERDKAMRYRLLETVRQYAHEKLVENGEEQAACHRHLGYFAKLAQQAGPKLDGPQTGAWLRILDDEIDNLRAAMQWALEADVLAGLRLATPLGQYWWSRSVEVTVEWFRQALQIESESVPGQERSPERAWLRAEALRVAGHLAYYGNTWERTGQEVPLLEESLALYRAAGPGGRAGMASVLRNLGRSALDIPDYGRAQALAEEGLALSREIGRLDMVGQCLVLLGRVASARGEFRRARALFEQAIETNDRMGGLIGKADCMAWAGEAAFDQGDLDGAIALFQQGIALQLEARDYGLVSLVQGKLATIQLVQGNLEQAGELYRAALISGQKESNPYVQALATHGLGRLAARMGDYALARGRLEEALTVMRSRADSVVIARLLDSLAEVAAGEGQAARAACLLGAADGFFSQRQISLPQRERAARENTAATALALLGGADFETNWAAGRALTGAQAIAYALGEPAAKTSR
jgi:predicted ATPase/transcriptional regulator with XRE-family HTH domain